MKIMVIGSGGREHAICRSFRKSPKVTKLYCANGNAGIAEVAECVRIMPDDIAGLVQFASDNAIDLTFVGGETSLALGIVDEFEASGLRIIGRSKHVWRGLTSRLRRSAQGRCCTWTTIAVMLSREPAAKAASTRASATASIAVSARRAASSAGPSTPLRPSLQTR